MGTMSFTLERTARGKLVLTLADGTQHEGVMPVRSFPLSSPFEYVSLVSAAGKEVLEIERLEDAPPAARAIIEEELAPREFMPQILAIESVSSFAVPSTWQVRTDRGMSSLVLKAEEDIRRIDRGRLLVSTRDGMMFLIEDPAALDARSRKMLERFL